MGINQFFGDIYAISIYADQTDGGAFGSIKFPQGREVHKQLELVGVDEFKLLAGIKPDDPGPFNTKGMRGCAESHLYVVKQAKQHNLSSVLIVEDDVLLWPDFTEKWGIVEVLLTEVKDYWDLFYFYSKESAVLKGQHIRPLRVNGEVGGHMYAVHSRFYDRYIEAVEAGIKEGRMQDETLYALPDKIVYAIHPPMAGQAAGYSSVTECERPERFMPVEKDE